MHFLLDINKKCGPLDLFTLKGVAMVTSYKIMIIPIHYLSVESYNNRGLQGHL